MPGKSEADESTLRDSSLTSDPAPADRSPGKSPSIEPQSSFIGQRCGPYQIVREIGRGGMGAVYLAGRVDDEFKQRVALKVLRTGINAEEVLRRFRHERQILATLDHPNIARLLDGGSTASGEPYLVMDYVEGTPLDQFCDNNRLSIPERIELFRQLCAAVQYVHQNLIVHRDLKPGNILVRADRVVKLLDFGIAKILKPDMMASVADATRANELLMTPAYASPEQARGEPITTVSDVYSLGIVLYELLTGQRPYRPRTDSALEIVRSICEDEPPRPSTIVTRIDKPGQPAGQVEARKRGTDPEKLKLRLKGDLDNILLKALRKEPQRRYASVEQFSADLERHLHNLPVLAHDDSRWYRAQKFIQRNRIAVVAAGVTTIALLTGIVATTMEARIASRERARAESRFQDVRKLASTMMFDVNDLIQNLPGSTPARSLIATTGTQYFDSLAREAQGDASLQQELVEGYLRVGDVEGDPFGSNLGHTREAIDSFRKALAIATTLTAQQPRDIKARQLLARSHLALADVLAFGGKVDEAYEHAGKAVEAYQVVNDAQPGDEKSQLDLSGAYERRGDIVGGAQSINLGKTTEALADYEKSLSLVPQIPASNPLGSRAARVRAVMLSKIGRVQGRMGHWAVAESDYQQALALATQLTAADPLNQRSIELVSGILNQLGFAQESLSELPAAQASFQRAAEFNEAALRADPNNSHAGENVMVTQKNLGDLYFHALQKMPEALRCYRRVGELLEAQAAADPNNLVPREHLAVNDTCIASTLIRMNQPAEARRQAMAGLALSKQLADRPAATYDQLYNYAWLATSVEPTDLEDAAGALPYIQRAVAMDNGTDPLSLIVLADAYAGTGNYAQAVTTLEKADALFPTTSTGKAASRQQEMIRERLATYRPQLAKAH
jgi:eukaryotic-like serine/threonine-protein kinase